MIYKILNSQFEFQENHLTVNGNSITCPTNVLQALKLFLKSQNQVISKEMLMSEIWNDVIVSDDSLFKIIQGVRKILKDAKLNGALINVYGKGYKIEPKILILESSETLPLNKKNSISKLLVLLPILVVLGLVSFYLVKGNQNSVAINSTSYQELKNLGKTEAPELLNFLSKNYSGKKLLTEDIIKVAYLKGFAFYKQGNYTDSVEQLKSALKNSLKSKPISATADAHLLLANIYVYQSKFDEMKQHLTSAEKLYSELSDTIGKSAVNLSRGRYFMAIDDFDQSFEVFASLMNKSKKNNDIKTQINVLYNTSYMHELLGDLNLAKKELNQMLELSLNSGDGENLAKAYSSLSSINKQQGNFIDAMKQAQSTIRYAIDQNDTNRFQQSFSSLYNILNKLGHEKLAEHYLQVAIDFQFSRNSAGRLTIAELNLGIVNLQKNNFKKAQDILEKLMSYQHPSSSHLETKAWLALTRHYQQDNINAYSLSHEVYNHDEANKRTKLIAGIALAFANFELERFEDAETIFKQLLPISKDKWLIEKSYFIDMALTLFYNRDDIKYNQFSIAKDDFDKELNQLKIDTLPEDSFLLALDNYINTIFKP